MSLQSRDPLFKVCCATVKKTPFSRAVEFCVRFYTTHKASGASSYTWRACGQMSTWRAVAGLLAFAAAYLLTLIFFRQRTGGSHSAIFPQGALGSSLGALRGSVGAFGFALRGRGIGFPAGEYNWRNLPLVPSSYSYLAHQCLTPPPGSRLSFFAFPAQTLYAAFSNAKYTPQLAANHLTLANG